MIELKNVNKYFNKHKKNEIHVINDVSLKLDKGLVAILGASGSGKTTLLNAIGGLDKVSNGEIFVNGKKITKKSVYQIDKIRNLNIGYIFQDYKLVENMTVFNNVALVLKMIGIKDKNEIKKRVDYILESVGIYRYRNRPVTALSGGERQRVGIARALVKNPDIIIADEPTGNLDSNNSLEIMNIIKSISKEKLVILVTHETALANFYATRIIEIEDGKIVKDYKAKDNDNLDYKVENKFYLKDFANIEKVKKENININFYSNDSTSLNIDVVVKNGNIYIKSNNDEKLEVIDSNSNIELIDEHYKKIDKSVYQSYEFDFDKIIDNNIKKKYSSILNPITLITNGFKKVFKYSFLKKLLLLGFFMAGMFTCFSISNIIGITEIKDEDFVNVNRNYLVINTNINNVNDYLKYEKISSVDYILPGDSLVRFNITYNDYYQTSISSDAFVGSLATNRIITKKDLILGNMPTNDYEIVLDEIVVKRLFANKTAKQVGINSYAELLNRECYLNKFLQNFKIVGIVSLKDPSIYVSDTMLINIIANSSNNYYEDNYYSKDVYVETTNGYGTFDYELFKDKITLTKGRIPTNDYEVILNNRYKDMYKLNKTIDTKINDVKLKVVGYYSSQEQFDMMFVNNNTIKYKLITETSNLTIYAKDKTQAFTDFHDLKLDIIDSYTNSRNQYVNGIKESITTTLIVAVIILAISLIEIFLMIRSSFLSRVKEIGIFRAIGVKKSDIYRMFSGEIFAITTIASVPGVLFMSYIVKAICNIPIFASEFKINWIITLMAILFVYLFNLFIGLIPVFKTLIKTPSAILSRHDLD